MEDDKINKPEQQKVENITKEDLGPLIKDAWMQMFFNEDVKAIRDRLWDINNDPEFMDKFVKIIVKNETKE